MKRKLTTTIEQLGFIAICAGLLLWLGGVHQADAAPPEPTTEPGSTLEPPPGEHTSISIGEHMTIDTEIEASPQSLVTRLATPLLQDSESAIGSDNAISLLAVDGHWTGTTNRGQPMSFDVASGGATWSNFKLKTNFSVGGCSGTVEKTIFGPGPITNNQFSSSTASFSFSGQFNSAITASGSYAFNNEFIPGCGNFTQSGTWTASIPISQCEDTFESDNTFASAKSIPTNGTVQTHNFHVAADEDWVKFTMTAGKVYTITTSNLDAGNDTYMYLYDTNGTSILAQDDDSGPGFGSQIVWSTSSSGTYYVRVRHFNNLGGCPGYNYNLAVTEGSIIPPPPPNPLIATLFSQTQINLLWGDNSNNETGFKIERSPNEVNWTQIATAGANITTYTNTGLTCDTTYYYRVRAYNGAGNSAYSSVANATTLLCPVQTPIAPSNLTANPVSKTQINLTWKDNSTNETGFKVEQSSNGLNWTQIITVGANVNNYNNSGLSCDLSYFYRVRAYNSGGNSAYSNIANATPDCQPNINIYLPLIMKAFTPPPPPPPGSNPVDGHWAGTTSRSQPMSFDVSSGGTLLSNFKLKTDFQVGLCSGTIEITIPSSGTIANNQFTGNSGDFSFSGQFTTPTSASGTYAYVNHVISNCGLLLNQSGTWTANAP